MKLPMPFPNPASYVGHSGVDFAQPRGTLIKASGDGVMGLRNTTTRGGITAWVDYDGMPGVAYAHLDNYQHTPRTGVRVREGDVIGAVGMSGFTTGPHLHSEVYGHATSAGYWLYFDRTRYVGQGGSSGGGSNPVPTPTPDPSEDDMTPEQDKLLRAIAGYLYDGGTSVDAGTGEKNSVFGRIINIDRQVTGADGAYKDTNTNARLIRLEKKLDALIASLK